MNTLIKLRRIFQDIFDDDTLTISAETLSDDIDDWDSVAHVKLILMIEEEFGIRFTTDEVASIKSVANFLGAIEKHSADH